MIKLILFIMIPYSLAGISYSQSQVNRCNPMRAFIDPAKIYYSKDCGESSKLTYIAKDKNNGYLQVDFDESFFSTLHKDSIPGSSFKNCAINFITEYPKGCTFSPSSIELQGYSKISRGHTGEVKVVIFHESNEKQLVAKTSQLTQRSSDFLLRVNLNKTKKQLWAPCTQEASTWINISFKLSTIEEKKPANQFSKISANRFSKIFQNTNKLGFKPCVAKE